MRDIIFSLGSSIISKLVMLIINIISYRLLDTPSYGIIAFLLAMSATVGAVSNMGASVAVNSVVAKDHRSSITNSFLKANYILSFFLSLVLAFLVYLINLKSINYISKEKVIWFIVLFSIFSSLNGINEAILAGLHDFKSTFINNLINFIIFAPITLILITKYHLNGVLIALISYRLMLLITNGIIVCKHKVITFEKTSVEDKKNVMKYFRHLSIPSIISGVLVAPIIGIAFKIFTSQPSGLENLGQFNIIYQIYLVAVFVPSALNGYLISRFSKNGNNINNKKNDLRRTLKYNLAFSTLVCLALIILQKLFFLIIAADTSSSILRHNYYIMSITVILFGLNAIFGSYWPSVGKAWLGLYMNLIWAVSLILITFILSNYSIAEALAWGFFGAYFILSLAQFVLYKRVQYAKI